MTSCTSLEAWQVPKHTRWTRYAIWTSRLGLGLGHGVLSHDSITQPGFGEVVSGCLVVSGRIWSGQENCGGWILRVVQLSRRYRHMVYQILRWQNVHRIHGYNWLNTISPNTSPRDPLATLRILAVSRSGLLQRLQSLLRRVQYHL